MNRYLLPLLACLLASCAAIAETSASKTEMAPVAKPPVEFDKLKQLAGTWEGKSKMHTDKEQTITVTYEVISAGSAVMERLFPGTPHEMVSIYAADGDKIHMTHYCGLGNHPVMQLQKISGDKYFFEMNGTQGIASADEPHMHQLTLTMRGKDKLRQDWVLFVNGKKQDSSTFNLTRVTAAK